MRGPTSRAAVAVAAWVAALAWCAVYARAPYVPRLAVPHVDKLVIIARALVALAALQGAALGASAPLARWMRDGTRLRRAVWRLGAGFAVLGTALCALGVAGWFRPATVAAVVLAAALAGVPSAVTAARSMLRAAPSRETRALVACVGLLLLLPALHAFVPRYGWDALTYHLALPERFLRAGRVGVDPDSVYTSFPLLAEMLYAAALALHGPALAKLVHLEFGALALALLADLARRHAPRAWPLAVVALAADPTFLWETTTVYNDLALVLFATAALDASLDLRDGDAADRRARLALFAGACVATRYPGALAPASLGLALLTLPDLAGRRRALALTLAAGVAAALLPWLARNLLATGNPLATGVYHPMFLSQMWRFNHDIGMGHGPLALLLGPVNVTFRCRPGYYSDSFGTAVGALHIVGALALALSPARRGALRGLGLAAAVYYLGWFVTVQESRYLLPLFPLLALATAVALDEALAGLRPALRTAVTLPFALALVGAWTHFSPDLGPVFRVALGDVAPSRVARLDAAERVGDALRARLPRGARVLPIFESRGWFLRGVDHAPFHVNQGSPVWAELHDARRAGNTCAWLARRGVTHVLVNMTSYRATPPTNLPGYTDADIMRDMDHLHRVLRASSTVMLREGDTTVYALTPGGCVDAP